MPHREPVALVDGMEIGRVVQDKDGRYSLSYAEEWRRPRDAVPLSISMPLSRPTHAHTAVAAFLWGLLPDNQEIGYTRECDARPARQRAAQSREVRRGMTCGASASSGVGRLQPRTTGSCALSSKYSFHSVNGRPRHASKQGRSAGT